MRSKSMSKWAIASGTAVLAAVSIGWAWQSVSTGGNAVYDVETAVYHSVPGSTSTDHEALMTAFVNGVDPDPMWVEADGPSRVRAVATGIAQVTTRAELHVITVDDDLSDLDEVSLYLDSSLVDTATLGSGVTDNGDGTGTAVVNVWVPRDGTHEIELVRETVFGEKKISKVSY